MARPSYLGGGPMAVDTCHKKQIYTDIWEDKALLEKGALVCMRKD